MNRSVDYYVDLIAKAASTIQILTIVRAYLWSWPAERIARVRDMEGNWAPFDRSGQPCAILTVIDLYRVCEALKQQCASFKKDGTPITAEFAELESLFAQANQAVRTLGLGVHRANQDRLAGSRHVA
jgi:hypothetical protein